MTILFLFLLWIATLTNFVMLVVAYLYLKRIVQWLRLIDDRLIDMRPKKTASPR